MSAAGRRWGWHRLEPEWASLRARFAADPVRVVEADLLRFQLPRESYRVVANPPYAVSAAMLRRLLAPGSRLVAADLVLPRWVVARYADGRGAGAGRWSRTYVASRGLRLPRHAFVPPPPGDWTMLTVRRLAP